MNQPQQKSGAVAWAEAAFWFIICLSIVTCFLGKIGALPWQ